MTVIQYRKIKCDNDNCKKKEEIHASISHPPGWFELNVYEQHANVGEGRLHGDFCSEKCVIEYLNNVKKLNPKKPMRI